MVEVLQGIGILYFLGCLWAFCINIDSIEDSLEGFAKYTIQSLLWPIYLIKMFYKELIKAIKS